MKDFVYYGRKWLMEYVKYTVKSSTLDTYNRRFEKYIVPFFENKKLEDITNKKMESFYQQLVEKKLKISTIKGIVNMTSMLFEFMLKEGMIMENPCKRLIIPKQYKKKVEVFSQEEQKCIINEVIEENTARSCLVLLALLTGMRISELCALSWEQVDMHNKMIHVIASSRRIKGEEKTIVIIDTPKSAASLRSIPITDYMLKILNNLKKQGELFVFSKKNGQRYDNRGIQKYFQKLLIRLGINNKNFHTLRHTFATMAIQSGMDVKTLSGLLGHSDIAITMNLYVHPNEEYIRETLANVFIGLIEK